MKGKSGLPWPRRCSAAAPVLAQPIVIGVSTRRTGPLAAASEWEMWGVNLAVDEINARAACSAAARSS
jgi:ABC-type branched-subunit amino acid transport system substrate-binding protein